MEEKKSKSTTPEIPFDLVQDDPMSRFFTRVWDFCYTHVKEVLFAGVAVVLVVGGTGAYFSWKKGAEQEAATRLGLVLQASEMENNRVSPKLMEEIRDLALTRPGTVAGRMARVQEARMLLENGDAQGALKAYDAALAVLGKDRFWANLIVWERAHVYMALGNAEAALADFSRAASQKGFLEESALFHMARLQAGLGELEKGRATFGRLLDQYPDSPYKETGSL
ncbi:tetratricopeptide repeat protein [Desulfobotulus sp.]|jgi:tetratricopeptide (TPR) repeat protein|uniref:tetratricopeptide repeat protein n=1 Tax=Desulfobotulus sp. TaxID=1940337 RepID=UPI002A369C0D|nr:tetratricopeptide repeat protein [Desulfobotulus sp.]MDY0162737.1 tetratricopeptide repeat protein [Desulfobotulus sp.]